MPESFIHLYRHGQKLNTGEKQGSLNESGLTVAQQNKWNEAVKTLNGANPELKYENVSLIEAMAESIYRELPEEAAIFFLASKKYPRILMTTTLLAEELIRIAANNKKKISISSIWEPKRSADMEESISNLPAPSLDFLELWRNYVPTAEHNDTSLQEYLTQPDGNRAHPKELQITLEIVQKDLQNGKNSVIRQRGEQIKLQIEKFVKEYQDVQIPKYLFAIGQATTLIAADVVFNNRHTYSNTEQMPQPLTLLKINC